MSDISKKDLSEKVILEGEGDTHVDQTYTDDTVGVVETSSGPGPIRKILNNIFKTFMWIIFFVLLIWYYTVNPSLYHKTGSGIWNGLGNLYTYTRNVITGNDAEPAVENQDIIDQNTIDEIPNPQPIQEQEEDVSSDDVEVQQQEENEEDITDDDLDIQQDRADEQERIVNQEDQDIDLNVQQPAAVVASGVVIDPVQDENSDDENQDQLEKASDDVLSGSVVLDEEDDTYTGIQLQFEKGLEFSVGGYEVEVIDIPDGESVELKQDGYHIKITNK